MAVKPLNDLLQQADKILGVTKVASASKSDEVSSLADTLAFATGIESQYGLNGKDLGQQQFEKVAKAMNKIAAQEEIQTLMSIEAFTKTASDQGYTEEQIREALEKEAAKKVKKNLSTLIALSEMAPSGPDKNTLKKTFVHAVGNELERVPNTQGLGGLK